MTSAVTLALASPGSRLPSLTSFDIPIRALSAAPDQSEYTVPKNVASAVRIVVRSGDQILTKEQLAAQLGGPFTVNAELSGPGLSQALTLPALGPSDPPPEDPLLIPLPALATAGDYKVSNIRIVRNGSSVLDVSPAEVAVKIIDQILVTSVTTRPLTLEEIQQKGIVLDGDDYLGFEFQIGMATGSESVSFSMPVIFDRQGVPVPQPISPPADPPRVGVNVDLGSPPPLIIPALLAPTPEQIADVPDFQLRLPDGRPIQIPSVLVIPGNVGYLKQFFSAQLFVANGAPGGSNLVVRDVTGKVNLPRGPDLELGTADDPLALPETIHGPQAQVMAVRGVGLDGEANTADDTDRFRPGEQGQAEFLIRGEQEGFHALDFDVLATLEGLPVGPVNVTGKARGGVLVRNPFFDMTFTVPSTVRQGEVFSVFATVSNIGQGVANDVSVTLDASALAGATLISNGTEHIATLKSGDSHSLEYQFLAQRTGQVQATYLNFDSHAAGGGQLKFMLGVGERGIALSPDTLVLPSGVEALPASVVSAAMRVLGQAWSIANAPTGTLPPEVIRIQRAAATAKALALAEAGLRVKLGQGFDAAVRDLAFDFYGGAPQDPGFDQLLRETEAGRDFARALGAVLAGPAVALGGALELGKQVDRVAIAGADFLRFAVSSSSGSGAVPAALSVIDAGNRRTEAASSGGVPSSQIPGGVWLPLGPAGGSVLGLFQNAGSVTYRLELAGNGSGSADVSVTLPRGGGAFTRGTVRNVTMGSGSRARLVVDLRSPDSLLLESDLEGDGIYESSRFLSIETLESSGPELISATVVGPETIDGASPLGFHLALLFDRVVDPASAAIASNYVVPTNAVLAARSQLSGRIVFASLAQPEGPYVPTTLRGGGVRDLRGHVGPTNTRPMAALLDAPGAVVSGHVIGPDGEPVTSGTVTYENNANWRCSGDRAVDPEGFAVTQLDASGRYEFRFVRQDQCGYPWAMLTSDPRTGSLRRVSGFVRAAGEQIVLDIALLGQGVVRGTVRNLQANPVPGAAVTVVSKTDAQVGASTVTDGEGHYEVSGVTVGPVNVSAAKGSGVGRATGSIARAGGSATVDVTIDSGAASVSGSVFAEEGSSSHTVPGASVVLEVESVPVGVVTTDADGEYEFDSVPAGPFKVRVALNSRDRAEVTGVVAAGEVRTGVDLVVHIPVAGSPDPSGTAYGGVEGVVRYADGTPASAVVVSVADRGLLSADDGSFVLTGVRVAPGVTQTVSAATRDGLRSGSATFVLNQAGQVAAVAIVLSGLGNAEFTVLSASGQPVVGQQVGLLDRCLAACGCAPQVTNAQGKVVFHDLPVGAVHVHAVRSGQSFVDVAEGSASITQDGQTGLGTLRFAGSGIVSGVVRNPQGQPVYGADVALSSAFFSSENCGLSHGASQSVRTDTQGRFRFVAVNLGAVSVTASQAFFPNPTSRSGVLTADGQEISFDIPLQEGVSTIAGVLDGVVRLPDGVTPAGAGIEVTASGPLPDVPVKTDAAGHYKFAKVFPEGNYTLTAKDPITGGVARTSVSLRAGQDEKQDIRLLGRGTVLVRVVDANEHAVANAFVRLKQTSYPNDEFEGAATAANQGVVHFDNVFEGALSAEVSDVFARGGRASGALSGPGATLELKVRLSITGSVSGIFLAADGTTPVPFGQVTLSSNGRVLGQTTTSGGGDALGRFHFDHVPAGSVRVEAQDPATARTGFAVGTISEQDQPLDLTVRAQGLGTVEGLVLSNGAPQALADVSLVAGSFRASTSSDAQGRYRVTGVPEGQVSVSANLGQGFLAGSASGTLVGDGSLLTLDVPLQDSGGVGGLVVHADGVTPAPQAAVTLSVGGTQFSTVTGSDGRFAFTRLPAGSASIAVDLLGSIDQGSGALTVPTGATVQVKIQLHGVGSIRGVARTASGAPTAGTLVVTGTGGLAYSTTRAVASDGAFALPEVLAGPFTLSLTVVTATFPLYGTASGTVIAGQETNLDVKVQASGTVRGRVLRPSGAFAYGTKVTLRLLPNRGSLLMYAAEDGTFSTSGVPLGDFELSFEDPFSAGVARLRGQTLASDAEVKNVGDVVLDETPVEAVAFDPENGATGVPITQPLRVTFSDPLAAPDGVVVSVGSEQLPVTRGLSSDGLTVTLNGTWRDASAVTVTATTSVRDVFGRYLTHPKSATFHTVDLSPPHVASVIPADGAIEVASEASVEVVFDEPLSPSTDYSTLVILANGGVSIPGSVQAVGATRARFTQAASLPTDSAFTVSVNGAIDASGNHQTAAFTSSFRTHDSQPPLLTLTSPSGSAWLPTAKPSIVVSLSDGLSGIDAATGSLSLDGTNVTPNRSPTALSYTPTVALAEGPRELVATVRDRAGNLGTLNATLRIDTLAPSAPVLSGIASGDVLIGNTPIVASATDTGSGVATVQLLVDGVLQKDLVEPDFTGTLASSTLSDGVHVVTGKAVDRAGNVSAPSPALTVVVDNVPLVVSIDSPAAGTRLRSSVQVTATTSEPVTQVSFSVGDQTIVDTTAPFAATFSLASVPEGSAIVTVSALGLLGETASTSREIVVDRTPPSPPVVSLIAAEPPDGGFTFVHGEAGAVEASALVTAKNTAPTRPGTGLDTARSSGAFALQLPAAVGDVVALTATDTAGNVSEPVNVTVRATTTLPPEPATVRFDGIAIDRVSPTSFQPDGVRDALFAVQFSMPATTTRQLAFVELEGPRTLSTRQGATNPLAVSGPDLGSPLLNDASGQVSASITGDGSLLLYAPPVGFIEADTSYRVTVAFTNGSRFIGVAAIGALPREEVASGFFSVRNQYVPLPGGGDSEPQPGGGDPLHATEATSGAFTVFNQYFPKTDVVNARGGGQPTDVASAAFSVENERLPFETVLSMPGGGQPTEVAGQLLSIRNQQLPFAALTAAPGGLQPNDVGGPIFSAFNSKLPFENLANAPGGFQPTEIASVAVSVNNDPNAVIASLSALSANALGIPAARIPTLGKDFGADGSSVLTLFVSDVGVTEGAGLAEVEAVLSSASPTEVSVDYALERDSLTPESEYGDVSGTLLFMPGETAQTLTIPLFDDTLPEQDEAVFVTLSNPLGIELAADEAIVTVHDDDVHPPPRAELFDDFEGSSLDGRWQSSAVSPRLMDGVLELKGTALRTTTAFGRESEGVSLSARVRFSGSGERLGFMPADPTPDRVAYYFESFGSASSGLGVRAVAEIAVDGEAAVRVLDEPLHLDPSRFADLRIDRTPDAVVFSIDGVELASTSDSVTDELEVTVSRSAEGSGPALDWLQVVSAGAQKRACMPLPSDVRAWWPADGDSRDRIGGHSSPVFARYARGRVGQAFAFEPLSHALTTLETAGVTPQAFTLALWVEPAAPSGAVRHLIAKPEPASNKWSFALELDVDNRLAIQVWDGTAVTRLLSAQPLSTGTLHHVAATRQGAELTLFVDGRPDTAGNFTGAVAYGTGVGANLVLGFEPPLAAPLAPELLDEITVHDRALAPREIFDLYQAGSAGYCLP